MGEYADLWLGTLDKSVKVREKLTLITLRFLTQRHPGCRESAAGGLINKPTIFRGHSKGKGRTSCVLCIAWICHVGLVHKVCCSCVCPPVFWSLSLWDFSSIKINFSLSLRLILSLKSWHWHTSRQKLDRNALIWRELKHPNVSGFLGIVTTWGYMPGLVLPLYHDTVVQYAEHQDETVKLDMVQTYFFHVLQLKSYNLRTGSSNCGRSCIFAFKATCTWRHAWREYP